MDTAAGATLELRTDAGRAPSIPVRIFDPIYVADRVKTHEDFVQILEYKPNSRMIKNNTEGTTDILI